MHTAIVDCLVSYEDPNELTVLGPKRNDFSIPFSLAGVPQSERFIGRESELAQIRNALSGDGSRRTVVLHGLGGMGKTQTAVAYAKRHRSDYSAVFWFNIQDHATIVQSFVAAAGLIRQYHPAASALKGIDSGSDADQVVNAVKRWFSETENTRWLAIFDNYDNPKLRDNPDPAAVDIRKYLPSAEHGFVIITTRSAQVRMGECMPMRKLADVRESVAILSSMSRRDLSLEGLYSLACESCR